MGQKVSPNSLRYGVNKNWVSRWNTRDYRQYAAWVIEDQNVRLYFRKKHKKAGIDSVEIERTTNSKAVNTFTCFVYVSQIGLIQKETVIEQIKKDLSKIVGKNTIINLEPKQIANAGISATLLAQEIADALEQRTSYRFIQKTVIRKSITAGAKGIKIKITGRINGNEIAWTDGSSKGSVPLSSLACDIDYAFVSAKTTYGILGVKVWVNRGLYHGVGFMPRLVATKNTKTWSNDKPYQQRNKSKIGH